MHGNSEGTGNFVSLHPEQIPSTPPATEEALAAEVVVEKQPSKLWPLLREIVETVLLAAVIWLAVNFATARYVVDGQSMEPNLHTGQFLIVSRLSYKFGPPQRGDIIVFDFPGNPMDDYVKRIIGLPGENVTIENGHVYINGQQLKEPYLTEPMAAVPYRQSWDVPEGQYFVMGDNRSHSSDSRSWGTLPEHLIIGKAWFSYWPPQHWGIIP